MSFKNINNLFIEERVINLKANLCLDNKEKSLKYINKFHSSEIASYLQLLDYNDRKKLIKILLVAASERGLDQTMEFTLWGCRAGHNGVNG